MSSSSSGASPAPRAKAPYEPPRVVVYGTLAALTQAIGNVSNMDGGAVNGMKRSQ